MKLLRLLATGTLRNGLRRYRETDVHNSNNVSAEEVQVATTRHTVLDEDDDELFDELDQDEHPANIRRIAHAAERRNASEPGMLSSTSTFANGQAASPEYLELWQYLGLIPCASTISHERGLHLMSALPAVVLSRTALAADTGCPTCGRTETKVGTMVKLFCSFLSCKKNKI